MSLGGTLVTVKLSRGDGSSWGFRLQGGKDFGTPLAVQRVNPNSLASQGGLQQEDVILSINGQNAETLRHKEAQDSIIRAGNYLELQVQRGGTSIWKPKVTPVSKPQYTQQLSRTADPVPLTKTSLAANKQASQNIGSSHNTAPQPFGGAGGSLPAVVNKQYNSPVNLYSMDNIAEALSAQTEVLATGAVGINFMKDDKPINTGSAVYQLVHQDETSVSSSSHTTHTHQQNHVTRSQEPAINAPPSLGLRHVEAPVAKPKPQQDAPATPVNPNLCVECGRLIVGVFVRVKDRSLHAECFRCATCGSSLKNVGYYNVNDKLYCDIHAKQAASMIGTHPNLEPITVAPGGHLPLDTPIVSIGSNPPLSSPRSLGGPQPLSSPRSLGGPQPMSSPRSLGANPPMASPRSPGTNFSNIAPVPFHRSTSLVHHVEAPVSPRMDQSRPRFPTVVPPTSLAKPKYPTSVFNRPKSQNPSLYIKPNYQSVKSPISPVIPPLGPGPVSSLGSHIYSHPQTAPPGDAHHRPNQGLSGLQTQQGQRPAPRRGRGQLKQQAGPGTRIPICSVCGTPIRGPFIVALGKTWCPDHFLCKNNQCRRPLADVGFVEEQGQLYCENCWEQYLAPVCCKCQHRIKGDCLNALDKQWHPECFVCSFCHKPFGNSSFYLEDGNPYCEKDWNELFTTKCVGCGFPIEAGDRWVEALNNNYHSQCFKCTICQKNLEGQSFYAKGGRPFCKAHAR